MAHSIADIEKQAESDLRINDIDLDSESTRSAILHNKYLRYFNEECLILRKLESDLKVLRRDLWLYYSGKADAKTYADRPFDLKVLKPDLEMFITSDEKYVTLSNKVEYQKQKVSYIEQLIKSLNNRTWTIKNIIEWKKFVSGG